MAKPKRGPKVGIWTPDKVKQLKKLFPKTDNETIADKLGVTVSAVRNKAVLLRLKKSERYWDYEDEQYLLENYPLLSIEELQQHLIGKTRWAIINKYRELTGKRKKRP